ncbi:Ger(x)C family spore germination protein [Neobacillus drentensis]|uniref:Ger(x)C family spore germination protein n=1 Tax=Neobacillus drentensis TaxID=220684 RepID=UPI0028652B72|nr:Ger(x)C family spore germination protein [Neobacillus drentensis]MDR7236772.1 spore germination protein [Neobacillus drentensis]
MANRTLLGIWITIFLLSGCSMIPTNIVNQINMTQGVGYDWAGKKMIKGTITYPIYKKDQPSTTEVKISLGETSKEIRSNINNESRYPLVSGQLRVALFGKSLAKKGITDVVDTLNRDPSIGSIIQMAVVDGDASELLKLEKFKTENVSLFLQEMLDQSMKSDNLPESNLQTYLFQFNQNGQDPYLPFIKQIEDNIKIIGIAILKDDRYVFPIFMKDAFTFKCLVDKYKLGLQRFTLENGERVVLDNLHSKAHYQVKIKKGRPEFTINLKLKTRLQEFTSPKKKRVRLDKKHIQKEIAEQLEENSLKLIKKFQKHGVDPLGLGAKYREQDRRFNENKWKRFYPTAKVHVHVKVNIKQTGTVD